MKAMNFFISESIFHTMSSCLFFFSSVTFLLQLCYNSRYGGSVTRVELNSLSAFYHMLDAEAYIITITYQFPLHITWEEGPTLVLADKKSICGLG